MKRIVVSLRIDEIVDRHETRASLDVRWFNFLTFVGVEPVLLAPQSPVALQKELCEECDGLLLTGGNDLGTVNPTPHNAARDAAEQRWLDWMQGKPVLGVCRGAQLLAVVSGGVVAAGVGHAGTNHALNAVGGGRWYRQPIPREVASYHNYIVESVGPGTTILAQSVDGAVELFEDRQLPRVGMMWHPERSEPPRASDVAFCREFFQ